MKALLTREKILAADDMRQERLEVPEWGGDVIVRGLTGEQRDRFENSLWKGRGKQRIVVSTNMRAKFVALSVVDDKGKLLFSPADVLALSAKSAKGLDRIFAKAQELSGISDEDVAELEGNLGSGPTEDSTSDSPLP